MAALTAGQYTKATDGTHIATEGATLGLTIPMLLSSTTVNLNEGTAAKQPLYTCPASKRCIITNIVMQKFSASGSVGAGSIGWNAGATDVGAYTLASTPVTTASVFNWSLYNTNAGTGIMGVSSPVYVTGTAADVLGLKVTEAEGSALTCKVDVYGYWTDTSGVPIANVVGTAP